jgi:hypothetical protein
MTRTSSRRPQWPREQAGRGCHLVELSKVWWNRVKHQPEPIRKASAEVAHRRVSLPPPQLPEISPAIFVTVRASPAPLYGQEMAEMAASRHLVCQQAVPWRATSGFALDGRTRARRDPSRSRRTRRGSQCQEQMGAPKPRTRAPRGRRARRPRRRSTPGALAAEVDQDAR